MHPEQHSSQCGSLRNSWHKVHKITSTGIGKGSAKIHHTNHSCIRLAYYDPLIQTESCAWFSGSSGLSRSNLNGFSRHHVPRSTFFWLGTMTGALGLWLKVFVSRINGDKLLILRTHQFCSRHWQELAMIPTTSACKCGRPAGRLSYHITLQISSDSVALLETFDSIHLRG